MSNQSSAKNQHGKAVGSQLNRYDMPGGGTGPPPGSSIPNFVRGASNYCNQLGSAKVVRESHELVEGLAATHGAKTKATKKSTAELVLNKSHSSCNQTNQ